MKKFKLHIHVKNNDGTGYKQAAEVVIHDCGSVNATPAIAIHAAEKLSAGDIKGSFETEYSVVDFIVLEDMKVEGEYGFKKVHFEGDEKETDVIAFGDGKTRINTLVWADEVGIAIYRDSDMEPFEHVEFSQENPAPKMPNEKLFITFDNPKSVDALIKQLQYVRNVLADIPNEVED